MTHVDYFIEFFRLNKRGTASDICQYLLMKVCYLTVKINAGAQV